MPRADTCGVRGRAAGFVGGDAGWWDGTCRRPVAVRGDFGRRWRPAGFGEVQEIRWVRRGRNSVGFRFVGVEGDSGSAFWSDRVRDDGTDGEE